MQSADAMGSEAMAKRQFGARLYTIQKGTGWNFRKARKMAVGILTQFKKGQVEGNWGRGFFEKTPSPIFYKNTYFNINSTASTYMSMLTFFSFAFPVIRLSATYVITPIEIPSEML